MDMEMKTSNLTLMEALNQIDKLPNFRDIGFAAKDENAYIIVHI